jgi:hypothetical protein
VSFAVAALHALIYLYAEVNFMTVGCALQGNASVPFQKLSYIVIEVKYVHANCDTEADRLVLLAEGVLQNLSLRLSLYLTDSLLAAS